jgi:hypothetical protein
MITMALQGGLGNQMFQYAMGLYTARRMNVELVLSTARLQSDDIRQYNLGIFNVQPKLIDVMCRPIVKENGLPYNAHLVDTIKDGDTLLGYWQSEKYFPGTDMKLVLDKIFQSAQTWSTDAQLDLQMIRAAGIRSTFIGIRRTDYLKKLDFHGVMDAEYYREGLQMIARKIGLTPEVFVFSDDPEWCLENLDIEYPCHILSPHCTTKTVLGREDIDIGLMSACQNAVIANSSFHWWGAWLGGGKNVIAPKRWFTAEGEDSTDIVPERWERI